ncbi:MAG TPA: hypothetical protein VHL52_08500 [Acidimicrobiia bacterium]|nr:hypothetical protein [Acidimicrobiia bacterium]
MNLPALLVAAVMAGTPVVPDLGGYLERSSEAEFSGEQLVSCETPDGSRSSVFNLAQLEGTVVAWEPDDEVPVMSVAPGVSVTAVGDEVEASMVEGTPVVQSDHYTVGSTTGSSYLGRPVEEVSILRDGTERVRLVVDHATDAVVRTSTYDGDGSLYCDRRLLSFDTDVSDVPEVVLSSDVDTAQPIDDAPAELPESIEGFSLVDTYSLADGTLSYYSDGFFSAGVVMTDRPIDPDSDDGMVEVEDDTGAYRRSYQAGMVSVTWLSGSGNMAVIGDLPPDLLEALLDDLPQPTQENFFDRLWTRLFG